MLLLRQVALACARLGQLLVWDWRAETYVLKQQGHYYDVAAVAYSPDGALLASGADDSKVPSRCARTLAHRGHRTESLPDTAL